MYTISDINYTIAGPFLILDFIYFVCAVVAILRFRTVYLMKDRFSLGLIFYISIGIHCFYRTITFQITTIISIKTITETNPNNLAEITKIIAILIYSSDITFWAIFLIFFWQLVVLLYVGHISKRSEISFSNKPDTPPPLKIKSVLLFTLILSLYITFQTIVIGLFDHAYFSMNIYIFINSMSNLSVPICIGFSELYFHKKFSGVPYKSLFFQRRKRKLNVRIVYWALGRTFHGILDLIILNVDAISTYVKLPSDPNNFSDHDFNMMTISILIILIDKVLFEIVPFLLVFDMDFVKVFFKINDKPIADIKEDLLEKNSDENKENARNKKENEKDLNLSNQNNNTVSSKFSTFIEREIDLPKYDYSCINFQKLQENLNKKNSLGTIQYALISEFAEEEQRGSIISINSSNSQNIVSTRCIDLANLGPYVTEEIMKDMKYYYSIQNNNCLNMTLLKGYSMDHKKLYLIFDDYSNGSLYSLIQRSNEKNGILSFDLKTKFAAQIAQSLENLHNFNPPIIHGHLSSHNILLDKEFFPKISDLFFHDLKKYYALSKGYSNKNAYTAPEYLKENPLVVTNPKWQADVYSFGMILWELFSEKVPFQDMKLKDLKKIVIEECSRPKIPEYIPFYIANLIRCCWQQDPNQRPKFHEICECLNNHLLLKHELSNSSVGGG